MSQSNKKIVSQIDHATELMHLAVELCGGSFMPDHYHIERTPAYFDCAERFYIATAEWHNRDVRSWLQNESKDGSRVRNVINGMLVKGVPYKKIEQSIRLLFTK